MAKPVILCVDDEPGVLSSLDRCLSLENFEVLQALDGKAALEILHTRDGRVDLMIVDQRMPGMLGDEFLAQAHDLYGSLKAIMLSGMMDARGFTHAVNDGGLLYFMEKPWDRDELVRIVKAVLFPEAL